MKNTCCHCTMFYEIRGRYHCLFKEGFGPMRQGNGIRGSTVFGAFLSSFFLHSSTTLTHSVPGDMLSPFIKAWVTKPTLLFVV